MRQEKKRLNKIIQRGNELRPDDERIKLKNEKSGD